jgi:hypothetical protein
LVLVLWSRSFTLQYPRSLHLKHGVLDAEGHRYEIRSTIHYCHLHDEIHPSMRFGLERRLSAVVVLSLVIEREALIMLCCPTEDIRANERNRSPTDYFRLSLSSKLEVIRKGTVERE